jgi:ankyrin repeat protein
MSLLAVACSVESKDRGLCSDFKPPIASATILNAIGEGRMQQLVDCGLKPDERIVIQGTRMTPMQFVASTDRPELVHQVAKAGGNPSYAGEGDDAMPPLEIALSGQKYKSASALLEVRASAGYQLPRTKSNALMAMAFDKEAGGPTVALAQQLVGQGAPLNGADFKGNTALHWSGRAGNTPYSKTLLGLGADACLRNDKGERPADVVAPQEAALKALLQAACKKPSS